MQDLRLDCILFFYFKMFGQFQEWVDMAKELQENYMPISLD